MKTIDFMGIRKICAVISVVLVVASLVYINVAGVQRNVDFEGGTKLIVEFNGDVDVSSLRDRVNGVDEKASINEIETSHGAAYAIKIKRPDVEEGKEAEAALARLRGLESAFGSLFDEEKAWIELLKTVEVTALADRLANDNPYNLEGTDAVKKQTYTAVAGKVKAGLTSAESLQQVAAGADAENAEQLAYGLKLAYPAFNRTTKNLLNAILKANNPLNRDADADYSDIAAQMVAAREGSNDFVGDMDTALAGVTLDADSKASLESFMKGNFVLGNYKVVSNETFSPSIAAELLTNAKGAVLLALFGILCYVSMRFQVGYGVASIVALTHDVIIALGVFALAGAELSNPVVAAFLTIVGYSLNDTIVVFDRIRDNLKISKSVDMIKVMNTSINQTLSRTIVTSLTTFFVVAVIYFFSHNATLEDFAFPLLVGVVVGTYSSIFVASPFLNYWNETVVPALKNKEMKAAPANT